MRLLKPSPGECADRQTILNLKIKYGSGGQDTGVNLDKTVTETAVATRQKLDNPSPVNIQPFIDENEALQRYLESNWFPDIQANKGVKYDTLLDELGELNHMLWKIMDQATVLKDAPDRAQAQANVRAAELLFLIIELNAKRARLVSEINELWEVRHQEKIYA